MKLWKTKNDSNKEIKQTMRKLKIDRIEGTFFICEDKEKKMFAIEKNEMPKDVKCGDTIVISDEGIITVSDINVK